MSRDAGSDSTRTPNGPLAFDDARSPARVPVGSWRLCTP